MQAQLVQRRLWSMLLLLLCALAAGSAWADRSQRPPYNERLFHSKAVDEFIDELAAQIAEPALAELFRNCFPSPLDTTTMYTPGNSTHLADTFVISGDIPAMWIRDALWQMRPYFAFASKDAKLADMLQGVLNRMVFSVGLDQYANAFNRNASGSPWNATDIRTPPYTPYLWEGKYEVDTLASFLHFSTLYFNATGDATPFAGGAWTRVVQAVLAVLASQQESTIDELVSPAYSFERLTYVPTDSLWATLGWPGAACGMVKTAFRPSDDAAQLPFNVAGNAFVVVALGGLVDTCTALDSAEICPPSLLAAAMNLAADIQAGIASNGIVSMPNLGDMYAYEVDGYGASRLCMDDANVPSLLSLPYLGFCSPDDPLYTTTRAFVLSQRNPYFGSGSAGAGIGSPHTGLGYIWPIGVAMQAWTSDVDSEIAACLATLVSSAAGTGFMHESFNVNNATDFTRPWFAWANSFFGDLVVHIAQTRPYLILKQNRTA